VVAEYLAMVIECERLYKLVNEPEKPDEKLEDLGG
jgi:hypothetical protein